MAQKNLKDKEAVRQENIEQTVSATEQFYNEHKKLIWGIVAAVLVVGLGILAYQKFIYQPKCVEAMEQCYPAEMNFQAGEYELALSGDGNNLGFADTPAPVPAKATPMSPSATMPPPSAVTRPPWPWPTTSSPPRTSSSRVPPTRPSGRTPRRLPATVPSSTTIRSPSRLTTSPSTSPGFPNNSSYGKSI